VQKAAVLANSPDPLGYPGLFICMPAEALTNPQNVTKPGSSIAPFKAAMITKEFATQDAPSMYCPETVNFIVPDTSPDQPAGAPKFATVTCIDFKPVPTYNASKPCVKRPPTCKGVAQAWQPCENAGKKETWESDNTDTTLEIDLRISTPGNALPFPIQVLAYSSDTETQNTIVKPPTTAAEYTRLFNLGSAYVLNVPTSSDSLIRMEKSLGHVSFGTGSCALEKFDLQQHVTSVGTDSHISDTRATLLFTYDTQEVVQTCSEPVLSTAGLIGILGGAFSLTIAISMLMITGINFAAQRAGTSVFDRKRKGTIQLGQPANLAGSNPGAADKA
jgi:hypothetical protein